MPRDESKYSRETNPALSALVAGTEAQHAATTSPISLLLRGYELHIDPGVFNPELSNVGDLLAENMNIEPGEVVLDLGTGSGFQALVASAQASKVYAVDSQAEAVACAQRNVNLNKQSTKIEVLYGDLFDPIPAGLRFDTILFNFPFVPWKPCTAWQRANFDERHATLAKFLAQAPNYLKPNGRILMTWSDVGDTKYFLGLVDELNYAVQPIVQRAAKGITHYVFEVRLRAG